MTNQFAAIPQELTNQRVEQEALLAEIIPGDAGMLSASESDALRYCESIIERGLKTFFEVGYALLTIREQRLYRQEYGTFEAYCGEKWSMRQSQAYRLMDAARVTAHLKSSPIGELPVNEAQARPLVKLKDPEKQREAWQQVIATAPDGRITAAHVEAIVRGMLVQSSTPKSPPPANAVKANHTPAQPGEASVQANDVCADDRSPQTGVQLDDLLSGHFTYNPEALQADSTLDLNGAQHDVSARLSLELAQTQGEVQELQRRMVAARSIIEDYHEQISRMQKFKATTDHRASVTPLLRVLERVYLVLKGGQEHTEAEQ